MKLKFYNKFLSILKVKPLAFVCSRIFYFFSVLCYLFKSLLGRKCICESSAEGVRDINFCLSPAAAKDIDLSIIIPTYNSKEYLAECIFSVINEFTPPVTHMKLSSWTTARRTAPRDFSKKKVCSVKLSISVWKIRGRAMRETGESRQVAETG